MSFYCQLPHIAIPALAAFLLTVLPLGAAPAKLDFNRDIRPILSDNCFACHGPDTQKVKGG